MSEVKPNETTRTHLKNVDQGSGQVLDPELAVGSAGRRRVPARRDEYFESR
jgi:hypothetical protein